MTDYISREAALEEAQRIRRNLQMLDNTQAADKMLYGVWRLEIEIEKLPAAPVREVVICQECRWKDGSECTRFADVRPFPYDYCSRGEKRDDA